MQYLPNFKYINNKTNLLFVVKVPIYINKVNYNIIKSFSVIIFEHYMINLFIPEFKTI